MLLVQPLTVNKSMKIKIFFSQTSLLGLMKKIVDIFDLVTNPKSRILLRYVFECGWAIKWACGQAWGGD